MLERPVPVALRRKACDLQADERMGLLLPCNVVVAESEGGETVVSILDPNVMERVADAEGIHEIADEARARLERALASIS